MVPGLVPGELLLNPEPGLRLLWGQQSGGSDSHITPWPRDTALTLAWCSMACTSKKLPAVEEEGGTNTPGAAQSH